MSELESILNYLETTSMEPHDDYTSEFSYKEQKVLWKYIKQLQLENKKYKETMDKAIKYIEQHAITVTDGTVTTNKHELLEILKEVG